MTLLKKTFQFSWIALVATVMLLSSCDNAQQRHDLDIDRVHNIMRYSDSIHEERGTPNRYVSR